MQNAGLLIAKGYKNKKSFRQSIHQRRDFCYLCRL